MKMRMVPKALQFAVVGAHEAGNQEVVGLPYGTRLYAAEPSHH